MKAHYAVLSLCLAVCCEPGFAQTAKPSIMVGNTEVALGASAQRIVAALQKMEPASLRSAVLLWKEGRQRVSLVPDYHCFRIRDVFVVGYGLDYNDEYRHLPHVATLEEHDH